MAHKSEYVATEIIKICEQKGIPLTKMKLIKLVYFAHAWYLGFNKRPLCSDPLEAWKYGPVFPRLYTTLSAKYPGQERVAGPVIGAFGETYEEPFSDDERKLLNRVVDVYGNMSAYRLSDLTHRPGTPWDQATIFGFYMPIDNNTIRAYYETKVKENARHTERAQ